jgi:hypothetical protein
LLGLTQSSNLDSYSFLYSVFRYFLWYNLQSHQGFGGKMNHLRKWCFLFIYKELWLFTIT